MVLDVVATGSTGNCYALRAGEEVLLLDAGVTMRKLLCSVKDFASVVGCLVTHEHNDHSRCAEELAQRGVRTICSKGTRDVLAADGRLTLLNAVPALETVSLGGFTVLPFQTEHDAAEPYGFVVRFEPTGETLLYATDTYYMRYVFPKINYWIVECNYVDEIVVEAVKSGKMERALRGRLLQSHMSLRRLKEAFEANDLTRTRKIVLVHLSDARSDEARMIKEISEVTGIEDVVAAAEGMSISLELTPF